MKAIQLTILTLCTITTHALSMQTESTTNRPKPRFHDYRTLEKAKLAQEIEERQKNIDSLALTITNNLTPLSEFCRMVEAMAGLSRINSEIAKKFLEKKDN